MNCRPTKDILRYHKIDCYTLHTSTTRKNWFLKLNASDPIEAHIWRAQFNSCNPLTQTSFFKIANNATQKYARDWFTCERVHILWYPLSDVASRPIDHIIIEPSDQVLIKIELRLQWHIFTLADASLAIQFLAYFD